MYCNRPDVYNQVAAAVNTFVPAELNTRLAATGRIPKEGDVKYVFVTKSGPGPILQPAEESLLDAATGLPVPPGPNHRRLQIPH